MREFIFNPNEVHVFQNTFYLMLGLVLLESDQYPFFIAEP